jgi:hypothetical protein
VRHGKRDEPVDTDHRYEQSGGFEEPNNSVLKLRSATETVNRSWSLASMLMAVASSAARTAALPPPQSHALLPSEACANSSYRRLTLPHELGQLRPEEQLCLVAIVRSTSKLNVLDRRPAAHRMRLDVVELEERCFGPSTTRADKSTACRVSPPYFSPDGRWDVARARHGFARAPRHRRHCRATPFEILEQGRQRAIQDGGNLAVRQRVPEQILDAPQLLASLACDGQLEFVAVG